MRRRTNQPRISLRTPPGVLISDWLGGDVDTNKAFRLMRVWRIFADGKTHKTNAIADMLLVNPKTIQRDIELLRDAGCDFESNRNGLEKPGLRMVRVVCPCCTPPNAALSEGAGK